MKQTVVYKLNTTIEQEKHLSNLCFYATKLYNTDNFLRRQEWERTGKIPNAYTQKKLLRTNPWFRLLQCHTAQEVCFVLQQNYNSWFKLRKVDATANPPRFRKKIELSTITCYEFKLVGDRLRLPLSVKYKAENKIKLLEVEVDKWKEFQGTPKTCQIVSKDGEWYAHIVYETIEQAPALNDRVMAVDCGIINTAVTCDSDGKTSIYSGKQILSMQHYFNKERAKLTSILTKQYPKRYRSRTLSILQKKQSRQICQSLHTHSKNIVFDCIRKGISTLVVGDVTDIRKSKVDAKTGIKGNKFVSGKNFGSTNNKLHSWSFSKFTQQLEYKCVKAGIRFVRVNEAYTSKTCSVCGIILKSNRVHRGLYRCKKCGNLMNADVNGAKNILKKYLRDFLSRSIGNVVLPSVSRITNVCPREVREAHTFQGWE